MSGLYAENIQNARINKYGQMVYGPLGGQTNGQHQNGSCTGRPSSHRPSGTNQSSIVVRQSGQKQSERESVEGTGRIDEHHFVMGGLVEVFNENFTDTDEQANQNMPINVSGSVDTQRLPLANSTIPSNVEPAQGLPL